MCRVDHLDPGSHQRVLMKMGLILLIIGHLNFIAGALVHGTVLRFVVNPQEPISLQYAVTNAASVISSLLTISCGIAALLLSRCLTLTTLKWGVLALSTSGCLSGLSCLLGLAFSIGMTLGNQGQALLAPCTIANIALAPVSRECPYDPTRVYSSTLSLWAISFLLNFMEIIFSIRCLLLTLSLLHLGHCCCETHRRKVTPGAWAQRPPTPMGLLAGGLCREPIPWAVLWLAEAEQCRYLLALSRAPGLTPEMSPTSPALSQPHSGLSQPGYHRDISSGCHQPSHTSPSPWPWVTWSFSSGGDPAGSGCCREGRSPGH